MLPLSRNIDGPAPRAGRPFGRALAVLTLAVALTAAAGGCASTEDATKPVTYSLTAKQNYEKGLAELKDEDYQEAQKYFQFVKQKFPFSKFAVLAELALADTQFAKGSFTDAVDSYKSFARLHPTHEKVQEGYVSFKIGECYVKDMPDDLWILPPSYEKDQSAVADALRELNDFVKKYPDSKYLKDANELRKQVLQRLVDHEVYVARFYLDRDHPKAAAMRLEGAVRRYPGSGRDAELLLALGQTYLKMNDPLRAKDAFQRVVADFGAASQARRAELYLEFIRRRFGETPAPRAPDVPAAAPSAPSKNG
ncbi:MAG TPA: outer membrane protein assembly factor BamD [Polyangia bacterium]|nr:outer membrane protein assembly factor BamD [Polyangia bacterium]